MFPQAWYDPKLFAAPANPSPLGLSLGILAVVVGQVFMIGYHWLHVKAKAFGPVKGVQLDGPAPHEFWEAVDGGCFRLATTAGASPASPGKKAKGAA